MKLLCYTRTPCDDNIYGVKLAYSVHFAYESFGKFLPLHHNEGIVFAKAVCNEDGSLQAKCLKDPWGFFSSNGEFCLVAVRTKVDGGNDADSEGCVLFFKSRDLVHFEEVGLLRIQDKGFVHNVRCVFCKDSDCYLLCWQNEKNEWLEARTSLFSEILLAGSSVLYKSACLCGSCSVGDSSFSMECVGDIEGCVPGNVFSVSDDAASYVLKKLLVPVCKGVSLSCGKGIVALDDVDKVKAVAEYSDGTFVKRPILWNKEELLRYKSELSENGGLVDVLHGKVLHGTVVQEHFEFPFAENRADPCCMLWNGKYYFIATNDADGNHSLFIRKSDTLEGVAFAEEKLLIDSEKYDDIKGLLWAPEFHVIGGRLFIFHAATDGEFFREESRVMCLKENGDPFCAEDWSRPHLVCKKDETPLCDAGNVISLDMTVFSDDGKWFAVWSQRRFLPSDLGAWLYIAQIDEKEPWKLLCEPVCLIKPEFGWENNHTFVVEGPYALRFEGKLMITYSAAAIDSTYTVGLLRHIEGTDILRPESWVKDNFPIMSSRSFSGQFGTGHNSYLKDKTGLVWNFYHGRKGVEGPRSSGACRVHFDIDGEPMLDVPEGVDLPKNMRSVSLVL